MATVISEDSTAANKETTKDKGKKVAIRGSSFTPLEDVAIAKSWIAASEDPIVGTKQKGNVFYGKIQKLFNSKFKPANRELRSLESIKTRCKAIHKECMLFSGSYARVVRSHPTGVSPNDILTMATAIYNGVQLENVEDDYGKTFRYMQAWRVLKQHQKFMVTIEGSSTEIKTEKNSSSSSKSTTCEDPSGKDKDNEDVKAGLSSKERPIGRKRAKELQQKKEESAKKLRIAAESVTAQQERNKALKRHYEIMLFTNAPSGCDNKDAVEYFNIMRARALSEVRKEEKSSNIDEEKDIDALGK